MNMTLEFQCEDQDDVMRDVRVVVAYSPERPAPKAAGPDDPRFSDPGDGAFCTVASAYYIDALSFEKISPFWVESEHFQKVLHEKAQKAYEKEMRGLI